MQTDAEFVIGHGQIGRGGHGGLNERAPFLDGPPVVGLDPGDQVALGLIGDHLDQIHQVLALGSQTPGPFTEGLPHGDAGGQLGPLGLEILEALKRGANDSRQGGLDVFQAAERDGTGLALELNESAQTVFRLQAPQLVAGGADGFVEGLASGVGHLTGGIIWDRVVFGQGIQGIFFGQIPEQVFLPPALEQAISDLQGRQVSGGFRRAIPNRPRPAFRCQEPSRDPKS